MVLAAGFEVAGVVVPHSILPAAAPRGPVVQLPPPPPVSALPMASRFPGRSVVELAWESDIPVWGAGRPGVELLTTLGTLQPDIGLVSCYPYRLPAELLAVPRHGFLNLHPSLLPAYRGPYPLFWQLRHGEPAGGVTLHWMDERLDTGDIALQEHIPFEDGWPAEAYNRRLGKAAGRLAMEGLSQLESRSLSGHSQKGKGSYFSRPTAADFALDLTWPARQAFNFMRGTAEWGRPYPLKIKNQTLYLHEALAWEPVEAKSEMISDGATYWLKFADGVLHAR